MSQFATIETEIRIQASAETIWNILTDFSAYANWNPFIVRIEGVAATGQKLKTELKNGPKTFRFSPRITQCTPNQYFEWLGNLGIPGLFDGRHYFKLVPISATETQFIHGEKFSGILSGWILKKIGADTVQNFNRMNMALRTYAEQQ